MSGAPQHIPAPSTSEPRWRFTRRAKRLIVALGCLTAAVVGHSLPLMAVSR